MDGKRDKRGWKLCCTAWQTRRTVRQTARTPWQPRRMDRKLCRRVWKHGHGVWKTDQMARQPHQTRWQPKRFARKLGQLKSQLDRRRVAATPRRSRRGDALVARNNKPTISFCDWLRRRGVAGTLSDGALQPLAVRFRQKKTREAGSRSTTSAILVSFCGFATQWEPRLGSVGGKNSAKWSAEG